MISRLPSRENSVFEQSSTEQERQCKKLDQLLLSRLNKLQNIIQANAGEEEIPMAESDKN